MMDFHDKISVLRKVDTRAGQIVSFNVNYDSVEIIGGIQSVKFRRYEKKKH